jgi:L,D-peptidoglycan transpeptidase YkuD (ErfK/YbiS/YcfS/YnhG family)
VPEKKPSDRLQVRGNTLTFCGKTYACAVGKNGFAADKKEGDGCTPTGLFALRECWHRVDRLPAPQTLLHRRAILENDGWCDAPGAVEYNRHIKLPFTASHEKLWREDHVYDLIIPLGYNDNPIIPGKGSAIFMHIAKPDYSGTEGCIALYPSDLLEILSLCQRDTLMHIRGA